MEPIRITTRRAAITLAILLIVAALFLSLGGPEPAAVQKTKWVDLSQTRILDMGGRNTLWVHVEGNLSDEKTANVTVRADLTEGALPRRMVLVDSARAGGSHFGALEDALKGALRPAGWKLDKENLSSLRAQEPGRVIVLPSGAWPSEALDNWTGKFTPDDLIIYMGIRQNISIGSDGTSQVGGVPDALAADGKPAQGYGAPLDILGEYEGPRVARIPHTLDEFMDMDELARAVARYAWEAPENRTIASVEQEWGDGANDLTANLSRDVSRGALRVRLIGPDGQPFKLWDRDLSRLPGEIDGPDRIVRAQTAAFQVRLRPDYPQKEDLEYDLHIYSIDGKAWTEERIGRGAVGLAAAGEGAWVGSFLVSEWPGPGMTRLEITDQFGRALAQAVVKIPQIT
ncbi:MAG: hypothetical protein V1728_06460, partial [Candidatus Micrarchaeota archaeon]